MKYISVFPQGKEDIAGTVTYSGGMTLREYYAGLAMQAYISNLNSGSQWVRFGEVYDFSNFLISFG